MENFKVISIFDSNYETIIPKPLQKTVCVFDFEHGKKAFNYLQMLDYAIALKEESGEWARCYSIKDLEEYYVYR